MRLGGVHAPASDRRRVALASVARAPYVHASPFAQTIVSPSLREQLQATLEGSYTLERAPAITGPWNTLAAPTAPVSGLLEYLAPDPV